MMEGQKQMEINFNMFTAIHDWDSGRTLLGRTSFLQVRSAFLWHCISSNLNLQWLASCLWWSTREPSSSLVDSCCAIGDFASKRWKSSDATGKTLGKDKKGNGESNPLEFSNDSYSTDEMYASRTSFQFPPKCHTGSNNPAPPNKTQSKQRSEEEEKMLSLV